MKILLLSDIHGNLPALEDCLSNNMDIDLLISLGDVVNFGPWSNECVELLETVDNSIKIKGNHEFNFIKGKPEGKNKIEENFFYQTIKNFNRTSIISKYLEEYKILDYKIKHTINNSYIFEDTALDLKENLIIGHSHQMYSRKINNFHLINPGSLGLNRRKLDTINYVIWDTKKKMFELKSDYIANDFYLKEIERLKYPNICKEYLHKKIN